MTLLVTLLQGFVICERVLSARVRSVPCLVYYCCTTNAFILLSLLPVLGEKVRAALPGHPGHPDAQAKSQGEGRR